MSLGLTGRFSSITIGDDIFDGEWHELIQRPGLNAEGWDTLAIDYVKFEHGLTAEDARTDFPVGQQLDTRSFWAQGISGPHCITSNLWKVTVTYKGIAGTKPVVVRYGASANSQSGKLVYVDGTLYDSVQTHENNPTASVRYVTTDVASLPMDDVATNKVPPSAPAVSASVWDFLNRYTYHYPNGWVLMESRVDPLPGTNVGLVDDQYQYIREKSPNG